MKPREVGGWEQNLVQVHVSIWLFCKKMLLGERDEDHVDLVVILNSMCVVQVNFVKTVEKKRNQKKYFVEVPD